jgi:hypothetical protein
MPKRYALIFILPIIPSSQGFAKAFFGVRPGFIQDGILQMSMGLRPKEKMILLRYIKIPRPGALPDPHTLPGANSIQKILLAAIGRYGSRGSERSL